MKKKQIKRLRRKAFRKEQRKREIRMEKLCKDLGFFLMTYDHDVMFGQLPERRYFLYRGFSLMKGEFVMEARGVQIEAYLERYWSLKAFL